MGISQYHAKVEAKARKHHKRAGQVANSSLETRKTKHIAFIPRELPLPGALRRARGGL